MKYIIDTNIIIRFLANDHKEHSPLAKKLFEKAIEGKITFILDPLIIAECVYVLTGKLYGLKREDAAELLTKIVEFPRMECPEKKLILSALKDYERFDVDFQDAYLAAKAEQLSQPILTFNSKDFKKMEANHANPASIE